MWGIIAVCYLKAPLPEIAVVNKSLSSLGMVSFSMYLLHLPLGYMVNVIFGFQNATTVTGSLSESAVRIPIIIAISFFTFYMIEKPFMGLRVKYTKSR